jgi:hypothetical protein
MKDRPDFDTDENYAAYCRFVISLEVPGVIPSTREDWVSYTLAIEQTEHAHHRGTPR